MEILNEEYFESMKRFRDNNNLQDELTDNDCICYANMFAVYSDITNGQFSFDEMLQTYDFITDIIDGLRPDIMIMNDKYRDVYRLLKRYSITKELDDDTRKKLAFLIYQAKCVMIMDEETGSKTWNMSFFENGTDKFLKEYEYEVNEYPSKFKIKSSLSNPSKNNFGLSIDNPIEVVSVADEYNYLDSLRTTEGQKIFYERIGSKIHKDGETHIDIYKIFIKKLFGNKEIATLYISGYGNENTMDVPQVFKFVMDNN